MTTHHLEAGVASHPDDVTCVHCVEDNLDSCPFCGSETRIVRAADPELGDPSADGYRVECSERTCSYSAIVPDIELEITHAP